MVGCCRTWNQDSAREKFPWKQVVWYLFFFFCFLMYNFLEAKHPSLKAISATFGVGIIVIIKWFCSKPVPKKFTRLPPAEISLPHILPYNGKFHSTLIFNLLNFKQDRSYCGYCCYSNSSRKTWRTWHALEPLSWSMRTLKGHLHRAPSRRVIISDAINITSFVRKVGAVIN